MRRHADAAPASSFLGKINPHTDLNGLYQLLIPVPRLVYVPQAVVVLEEFHQNYRIFDRKTAQRTRRFVSLYRHLCCCHVIYLGFFIG